MLKERSDWYPTTEAGKREMFQAIFANIDDVDQTLKMDATIAARLKAIAEMYLAYDGNLNLNRAALKALEEGFETIQTGNPQIDPMPVAPKYHALALPAGDFVGIEKEMRDIRRYMKGLPTWTTNMGDVLKMNGREAAGRNENEMSPAVKIKQIEGVKIYVLTKKEGMDGIEYQWRIAGDGEWQLLKNSGESDDFLEISIEAGTARKIEIRAHFLKKFKQIGVWSPTYNLRVGA